MKRDYHYTDVMYEIYKRHKRVGALLDSYSMSAKHAPLMGAKCTQCHEPIKGYHCVSEASSRMCDRCYFANTMLYYELTELLNKFNTKGGKK